MFYNGYFLDVLCFFNFRSFVSFCIFLLILYLYLTIFKYLFFNKS